MHLAKALRCEKEFLVKRSKKLILAHYDEKLKKPIALLREGLAFFKVLSISLKGPL